MITNHREKKSIQKSNTELHDLMTQEVCGGGRNGTYFLVDASTDTNSYTTMLGVTLHQLVEFAKNEILKREISDGIGIKDRGELKYQLLKVYDNLPQNELVIIVNGEVEVESSGCFGWFARNKKSDLKLIRDVNEVKDNQKVFIYPLMQDKHGGQCCVEIMNHTVSKCSTLSTPTSPVYNATSPLNPNIDPNATPSVYVLPMPPISHINTEDDY